MTALLAELALTAAGVVGLWGGTVLSVGGAVRIAERYSLSHGFVGLAILAVGTDLPELIVAIDGGVQQLGGVDVSGVVVGTAFGSAIAQGTLVLGVAGLFGYLPVAPRMIRRDGLVLCLAIALAAALSIDGRVSRAEGVVMVCAYLMYFASLWQSEHGVDAHADASGPGGRFPPVISIALGLVLVSASAHVVVDGSLSLTERLGISQTLVGVIFVGLGTSLPELALTLRAMHDRHISLSVGNVIGSNIFDLLVPIGVGATIHPLSVDPRTISYDLPALGVVTLVLLVFLVRRRGLQRHEAVVLLALYVAYAIYRVRLG